MESFSSSQNRQCETKSSNVSQQATIPHSYSEPPTHTPMGGLRDKPLSSDCPAVVVPPDLPWTAPRFPSSRTTRDPLLRTEDPLTGQLDVAPAHPIDRGFLRLYCSLRFFPMAPPSILSPFPISVPSLSPAQIFPPNKSPIHLIPLWDLPVRRSKTYIIPTISDLLSASTGFTAWVPSLIAPRDSPLLPD